MGQIVFVVVVTLRRVSVVLVVVVVLGWGVFTFFLSSTLSLIFLCKYKSLLSFLSFPTNSHLHALFPFSFFSALSPPTHTHHPSNKAYCLLSLPPSIPNQYPYFLSVSSTPSFSLFPHPLFCPHTYLMIIMIITMHLSPVRAEREGERGGG